MSDRTGRRGIVRGAALAASFAVLAAMTSSSLTAASAHRALWPAEADHLYLPPAATLKRLSLGHTEMAADLVAARTNVYFGTRLADKGEHRWLSRYIETALDLDPFFHRVYLSGAAMVVYSGGGDIKIHNLVAANRIIERGIQVFPYDWELYFYLAFNLHFELPQLAPRDPRVDDWRQRGVDAMRRAALFEGAPPWLPSLAARMLSVRGGEELAIRHLEQAYAAASTQAARDQIAAKLAHLRGKQFSARLEEERRQFDELLKGRYPYAPDAFSVVAGPRRPRIVTLTDSSK
jgi:hypothetical protein